jgi:hypothetical protein
MKVIAGIGLIPGLGTALWVLALAVRGPVPLTCSPPVVSGPFTVAQRCFSSLLTNNSPVLALCLMALIAVVGFAYLRFWTNGAWQPLFAIDVIGASLMAALLAFLLSTSYHKHVLTSDAVGLLPIVIAGLILSAVAAWVVGHRIRGETLRPAIGAA